MATIGRKCRSLALVSVSVACLSLAGCGAADSAHNAHGTGGTRSNATTPGGSKHGTYEASSAIGSGTVGHGNPGEAATGGRGDSSGTVVDDSIRELVNMGWRESAAKTVVAYNVKMLTILYEEDRRQWQVLLRLWGRLARDGEALECVERLPELTSLLANSREAAHDGPQRIARSLPRDPDDLIAVLALYELYCEPADCVRLADALNLDGGLLLQLYWRQDLGAVVPLLSHAQDDEAGRIYREWVRDVLRQALQGDDDELDGANAFLLLHERTVWDWLNKDEGFRRRFLDTYWPRYDAIIRSAVRHSDNRIGNLQSQDDQEPSLSEAELVWNNYVHDPRVWEYFHRHAERGDTAFEVFEQYSSIALDLLLDPVYDGVQDTIWQALRYADSEAIEALLDHDLRQQPLFRALLARGLPGGSLAKALTILQSNPAETPRRLKYWANLSDSALIEDLGPPPHGLQTLIPGYSVYYVLRKIFQGRETSGLDFLQATLDAAVAIPVVGAGGQAVRQTVGPAVRSGAARALARQAAKAGLRAAQGEALRAAAKEVPEAATGRLAPLVFKQAYGQMRRSIARQGAASVTGVKDITTMMRFIFQKMQVLGLGRTTMRRLTGLEARVFMRRDAQVLLDVTKLISPQSCFRELLRETGWNAGADLTLQTQPGQQAVEYLFLILRQSLDATEEQICAWRQHLAVWWTANLLGEIRESPNEPRVQQP